MKMPHERSVAIAVSVTAGLLATAAVTFTLWGNAPGAPGSGDLPVITVDSSAPTGTTATPTVASTFPPPPAKPPAAARPAQANATGPSGTKTSGAVEDHEVVKPRIHESDESPPAPSERSAPSPGGD